MTALFDLNSYVMTSAGRHDGQPREHSRNASCRLRTALLTTVVCIGAASGAKTCPPGVFDYGPPCADYAGQVVLCHHGTNAPLIPDPQECARAARDMALVGLTSTIPCGFVPNVILIQTLSSADPELLCMNAHFQAEYYSAGFDNWWYVEFPQTINALTMVTTYLEVPAVVGASINALGSVDGCHYELNYASLPDGTWHWIYDYPVPFHTSCRQVIWRVYVSESGIVMPPGDLTCDGVVNLSDVIPFVEALISPATFSGCNPFPSDVNGDGATDGRDIQPFVLSLAT